MGERIPNWLIQRSHISPNKPALVFEDQVWTFEEVKEIVQDVQGRLASCFHDQDIRAAILMKNHPQMVWLIYALQQLGIEAVFLNHRLTAMELSFQLQDSETDVLFYDEVFVDMTKNLKLKHPQLRIYTPDQYNAFPQQPINIRQEYDLEDTCSIMYTSGTTGKPKGVMQSYGNHWWNAIGSSLNLGLQEKDAWLCAVPLFHISGLSILMKSVIYGMPAYLMEQFEEEKANSLLQSGQVTIMSVVSAMLNRMLEKLEEQTYHPRFRCMLLGGGPAPLPLLERCVEKGIPIFQTYGMTETASQIVTLSPEDAFRKLGSAGKALFPAQIRITDTDGGVAEAGQAGEIQLKGPTITSGYLSRPAANAASFAQGWFKTGDIGYLDEEGFLYVLDRRSDLIISGGENIYPAEIEAILMGHEAIVEAGVIGLEDEKWGQVPYAFVVVKRPVTEERLTEFCRAHLAAYKVPKRVIQVKTLPRNAANKLLRRKLMDYVKGEKTP
ncbi:o-succinylbenzoate--CoA ligase [Lederbergia sp. NSJ-179]|uniref:o-succinylbenzoate--CoA ligase n=1 Tax=Lederbergia sp. NSJ-179 TaxID=2931402 RepID=UPI001FD4B635|nr:o-succinylbenzoate--CoA ligase [Lederbergia sp. NSJ-179]MCJ7842704.1 o-succinylbenzoate--CoA ligase [Lederbergia sp. NSJ-179]